jgi:hypothetical protein
MPCSGAARRCRAGTPMGSLSLSPRDDRRQAAAERMAKCHSFYGCCWRPRQIKLALDP